jgi:chemotaxis signal transduction protein
VKLPRITDELRSLPEEDRALLELRATRLRPVPQVERDESVVWVAVFQAGGAPYALPLEGVRAAMPAEAISPVPLSPPEVVGILRYERRVIVAFSLAALLRADGWTQDPAYLLVVDVGRADPVGLDCEQIPVATALPRRLVEAAVAAGPVRKVDLPDGLSLSLLDLPALLDRRKEGPRVL